MGGGAFFYVFLTDFAFGGGVAQGDGFGVLACDDADEGGSVLGFDLPSGEAGVDFAVWVDDVDEQFAARVSAHTGEFGSDGGAFTVEFVADGAGGLEGEFAFGGIAAFEDAGGEVCDEFFTGDSGWALEFFEDDACAFCEGFVGMVPEAVDEDGAEVFGGNEGFFHRVEQGIGPFGAVDRFIEDEGFEWC